jgi:hypothetical protein
VHKVIAGEAAAAAAAVMQHKHIAATVSPTQILQPKALSSKNTNHCQNKNTKCCTELKASSILCGRQTNKCELLIYFYTMAGETGNL